MKTAILYGEELKEYDFGPGHPFRGDRYQMFPWFLKEKIKKEKYQFLKAQSATDEDLLLICKPEYIEFTKEYYSKAAKFGSYYDKRFSSFHSGDNVPLGKPGKLKEGARLIIGQAKMACDLVESGKFKKVVSIGGGMHHAKPSYGEGFCIYNDVAFAANYLMKKYGLNKILILDTDAHAGNGTCEYFYQNPAVLFVDLHQDPRTLYPGTGFAHQIGEGRGKGYTINVPMPVNAGYDAYKLVFNEIVKPVAEEFNPQIIIRNGGSDPHFDDGLTHLGFSIKGFRMIGEEVREIAEICEGKEIDLIALGYNEKILPHAWLALISGLMKEELPIEEKGTIPTGYRDDLALEETKRVIEKVKDNIKDYWRCFA